MSSITTLNDLEILKEGIIEKIEAEKRTKNRLLDLGLVPGTKVRSVLSNYFGTLKAFEFKGTIIALRDVDSGKILVKQK